MSSERAPVVLYDIERSAATSSPDIPHILHAKRLGTRRLPRLPWPRPLANALTCLAIAASALQANGVYCWATYGPVVASMRRLDGTQAQTIVVGGIVGVYLMAAPLGSLTDRYGPRIGSLVSACLSAAGYLSFAAILATSTAETPLLYVWLTAAYFLVGAATVGSYFACLTCASLSFPTHPTLSLSLPLSLIGLSSLALSSFSSLRIFISPSTGDLDPVKFLFFLGLLSPGVNLFGALFMRIIQPTTPPLLEQDVHFPGQDEDTEPGSPISQFLHLSEHTPLLIGGPEAARPALEQSYASIRDGDEAEDSSKPSHLSNVNNTGPEAGQWGVWDLIADWQGFWIFGILVALVIGPGEMTIASIGSILTSLLPTPSSLPTPFSLFTPDNISYASITNDTDIDTDTNPLAQRNTQVFLISLSSTLARLFTGFLADYLSPPPTAVPNPAYRPDQDDPLASTPSPHDDDDHHAIAAGDGDDRERAHPEPPHLWKQIHKVRMSRAAMTGTCALLLGGVYVFAAAGLQGGKGEKRLWVLSVGVGGMYGALFTLTPAIVSLHFGPTNFGLAWGMISYFAALGSVVYSYLYALLSIPSDSQTECHGTHCFRVTFIVCAVSCFVGSLGLWLLGRRWKV
ncbi:hypothetical protein CNBA4850 [Cryptococcus deneoformans B-3501A]|nr:hypothetical protein CNBA4850 [Cryptococcus neoformans var. neoformans B-3501A]EAL23140.1 hypothetical protein CNBA4850 [Cryptococcus neoformans var. neoformans B-3501A]